MPDNEIKLKPCPFCGGAARLWVWSDGGGVCVRCSYCYCQTPTKSDDALLKHLDPAVEKVIEVWNRRATEEDDA